MKRLGILIILLALLFSVIEVAKATTIEGIATPFEVTAQIPGSTDSDGRIQFYVPLQGPNGTYGDIGMAADTITLSGSSIDGPIMDMYLYFPIPSGEIGKSLTLTFSDLDLLPYNDPQDFFERLILHGQGGLPDDTFEGYNNLGSLGNVEIINNNPATNDEITVIFTNLSIQSGGGDFWLHLGFQAYSNFTTGSWINTSENLAASINTSPAPEPSTMLLLGSGLIGLLGFRRKFRK